MTKEHSTASLASREGPAADGIDPLVSVVVPTHNVRDWIAETLQSVLSQGISMEVIVVDDHSADGTDAYVEELAARDARVRLVRATTRGGGSARNAGVAVARGRYLIFCDGDDLVPTGSYRALVSTLEASGSDIAFGNFLKFSPTRTWKPTAGWPAYQKASRHQRLDENPSLILGRACWNKAFRRAFWEAADIRFPDVPRSNDIVPMTTAYLAAHRVDVVDEHVYLYRERPGNSSMSANAESAASMLSYLEQEMTCAREIVDRGLEPLTRLYASLVLERDGWVHLARYLRRAERSPAEDAAVRDALAALVDLVGSADFRPGERHKSVVFRLFLEGRATAASAIARLMSGPDLEPIQQLGCVIDLLREPGALELVAEQDWLRDSIRDAVAAAILDGVPPEEAAAALIEYQALVRAVPGLPLRGVPELSDPEPSAAELVERLAYTRSADAAIVAFRAGPIVEVDVIGAVPLEPVLVDSNTAEVVRDAFARRRSTDAWTLVTARLPRHHRFAVAAATADGRIVTARLRAPHPPYRRTDAVLAFLTRRTAEIARRDRIAVRVTRQGRAVLRRLVRRS